MPRELNAGERLTAVGPGPRRNGLVKPDRCCGSALSLRGNLSISQGEGVVVAELRVVERELAANTIMQFVRMLMRAGRSSGRDRSAGLCTVAMRSQRPS